MPQRCTGPLVYTIKSGVLFVFLFVFDARHAFRSRGSERGVRGDHGKSLTGRGAQRQFRGVPGPGRGDTEFQSIYGPEKGRKMEKMAKIREIPEKSHDPNPQELCYLELPIIFFCSCLTILLIHLLMEEIHAATLHGTTRRNNDIQV